MGKTRWLPAVLVLCFLVHRTAAGQQPIHWDATIDSAKATAAQSNRLVLIFFCAGYCQPCHRLENELRNQPGAVAAMEANYVPVKISYEYYPNTAKQYNVTRLPTTVILAPNARGDVLAMIPEYMPVDDYLSKLNRIAGDMKRQSAGLFAQMQASPPVGAAVTSAQPPVNGPSLGPIAARPAPNVVVPPAIPSPATNQPVAGPMVAMATVPGLPVNRVNGPQQPVENRNAASLLFGLDGFCPVQLAENARWQPGKRDWGAIHRGRTYLFAGEEERKRFLSDPDRYAPVSSGEDVVLMLEQGHSALGCREHGVQFGGHVYLFATEATLEKFRSNPGYYAAGALQAMRSSSQTSAR